MRRLLIYATLVALIVGAALAADVSGKWVGEMQGGPGGMSITLNLKQDGAKLTGSIDGPGGETMEIKNGKLEGDKISFTVSVNDMNIVHEGKVKGDEMTLAVKMDGGPGDGPGSITLKRAK